MKRIFLTLVTVAALTFGGLFTSAALADGHHHHRSHHHRHSHHHHVPRVSVYSGYGGYGGYGGYCAPPVDYCRPAYTPYGAGYIGGYQPYQQFHYHGSRLGFSIGF